MAKNTASRSRSSRVVAPDPDQPVGKNLYIDKKRRIIYVSSLLHQALYLPRSAYKKYNLYRTRFLLALAVFLVLSFTFAPWFNLPLWACFLIALLFFAVLEYAYYRFLKTLAPAKNFDPAKAEPTTAQVIPPEERSKSWLRAVLYAALGILIVVNAYQQHYDLLLLVACWAAMAYCLYNSINLILILHRSPKA